MRSPDAGSAATYRIVATGGPALMATPQFQETARKVSEELERRGFRSVPDPRQADWVVEIDYGVRAPRQRVELIYSPSDPAHRVLVPVHDVARNQMVYVDATPRPARIEIENVSEKYLVIIARETGSNSRGAQAWRIETWMENSSETDVVETLPRLLREVIRHLDVAERSRPIAAVPAPPAAPGRPSSGLA